MVEVEEEDEVRRIQITWLRTTTPKYSVPAWLQNRINEIRSLVMHFTTKVLPRDSKCREHEIQTSVSNDPTHGTTTT